jgi:hypothetical protein
MNILSIKNNTYINQWRRKDLNSFGTQCNCTYIYLKRRIWEAGKGTLCNGRNCFLNVLNILYFQCVLGIGPTYPVTSTVPWLVTRMD